MNTQLPTPGETPRRRLHPLVAAAAVSVIVLSSVAVASLLGWIPTPWAEPTGQTPVHEAQVQAEAEAQAQQAATDPDSSSGEGEAGSASAAQAAASVQGGTEAQSSAPAPTKSASASKSSSSAAGTSSASSVACANCGVVEAVRTVQVPKKNEGYNVVGTVAGGVVGGVVGHQFGGGSGKDALTVLGAVGGALAGHEIERNIKQQQTVTRYELTVRMDNGTKRTFHSSQPFAYASGDHVRVENDQLLPR